MNYYFCALETNLVIPGDWEWYLNNYSALREQAPGCIGWKQGLAALDIRVREIPRIFGSYPVALAAFRSQGAVIRAAGAAPNVVEGAVMCVQSHVVDLVGRECVERNCTTGRVIITNRGEAKWTTFLPIRRIKVGLSDWSKIGSYAKQLDGAEIYAGGRYAMILREDVYMKIADMKLKAFTITQWDTTTGTAVQVRRARPPTEISAADLKRAGKEPFVKELTAAWEKATADKAGVEAAKAMRAVTAERRKASERTSRSKMGQIRRGQVGR